MEYLYVYRVFEERDVGIQVLAESKEEADKIFYDWKDDHNNEVQRMLAKEETHKRIVSSGALDPKNRLEKSMLTLRKEADTPPEPLYDLVIECPEDTSTILETKIRKFASLHIENVCKELERFSKKYLLYKKIPPNNIVVMMRQIHKQWDFLGEPCELLYFKAIKRPEKEEKEEVVYEFDCNDC